MNTKLIGMFFLGIVFLFETVQEKDWKDIVPLQSTRKDVERLVGSPQASKGVAATFQLKGGRLRVFYSDGFCKRRNINDWNVPPDTVVTLTFEPSIEMKIAELNLDMTKYERAVDPHVQRAVHYYNREAGIRISTRLEKEGEEVHSITYEPTEKDLHLRCEKNSQTLDSRPIYPGIAFDEYAGVSFKREKVRLDNLAGYLKENESALLGYYVVYRGRGTRSVDAELRAKRAKDYVVKVHGLDAKRIVTIMAGCREELEIVLYVIPNSMAPPIVKADCDK
jgi:hypothetical protein